MIEEETWGPAQASSCICAGVHTTRAIEQILMGLLGLHHGLCTVVLRSVFLFLHPNTHPVKHGDTDTEPKFSRGLRSRTGLWPEGWASESWLLTLRAESSFGDPFLASSSFSCVLLGSLLDPSELQFSLLRGSSGLWGG